MSYTVASIGFVSHGRPDYIGKEHLEPWKKDNIKELIFLNKRTEEIKFRTTKKEKERIKRLAKKCGLSVSAYLLKLANGYRPSEIPSDNFFTMCNKISDLSREKNRFSNADFQEKLNKIVAGLYEIYVYPKAN